MAGTSGQRLSVQADSKQQVAARLSRELGDGSLNFNNQLRIATGHVVRRQSMAHQADTRGTQLEVDADVRYELTGS